MKYRPNLIRDIAVLATLLLSPFWIATASAYTEYNKTISRLGVQGGSAYVFFVEGVEQSCNELYMSDDTSKKMLYAQLLAAKLSGIKIGRVDYSISNGVCRVDLIQLN